MNVIPPLLVRSQSKPWTQIDPSKADFMGLSFGWKSQPLVTLL